MKKKLITVLFVALIAISFGFAGSNDEQSAKRISSMAESEFISQVLELNLVCNKYINNLELCWPDLVIVDEFNNPFVKGKYSCAILVDVIQNCDFLTTIHGIDFYKLNPITIKLQ